MDNEKSNATQHEAELPEIKGWRDKIIVQILSIRDEGLTNMFDTRNVFELAVSYDYYELADFITANKSGYGAFIMSGDREKITNP